jgi:hypothetical protein
MTVDFRENSRVRNLAKATRAFVIIALWYCFVPFHAFAQQADAPVYNDGDWWRVRVELRWLKSPPGYVPRNCETAYPEYLVRIEGGEPRVFGVKTGLEGEKLEMIDCPVVIANVLGKSKEQLKFPQGVDLRFPLRPGSIWSVPEAPVMYAVGAWEKIKTPKGEFNTLPIARVNQPGWTPVLPAIYYYSPAAKAIVYSHQPVLSPMPRGGFCRDSLLLGIRDKTLYVSPLTSIRLSCLNRC